MGWRAESTDCNGSILCWGASDEIRTSWKVKRSANNWNNVRASQTNKIDQIKSVASKKWLKMPSYATKHDKLHQENISWWSYGRHMHDCGDCMSSREANSSVWDTNVSVVWNSISRHIFCLHSVIAGCISRSTTVKMSKYPPDLNITCPKCCRVFGPSHAKFW